VGWSATLSFERALQDLIAGGLLHIRADDLILPQPAECPLRSNLMDGRHRDKEIGTGDVLQGAPMAGYR